MKNIVCLAICLSVIASCSTEAIPENQDIKQYCESEGVREQWDESGGLLQSFTDVSQEELREILNYDLGISFNQRYDVNLVCSSRSTLAYFDEPDTTQ